MPKICEFETCRKYANYGEYHSKPIRCKEHKEEYKLVSQICVHDGCKTQPVYNVEGETTALYCFTHKLEGMVDVKHKKCVHPDCKTRPHYNIEGETTALYCFTHKLEGMIDVKSKTCLHPDCKTRPHYNIEGETTALYCFTHKLEGMINVKDKTCVHPGCKTIPVYNIEGETTALYCVKHKLEGMIDVKHKKCVYPDCKTRPVYNVEEETRALYCFTHKTDGMVDILHAKCKANYCLGNLANSKYKDYCSSCYQRLFPNDPLTLQVRSKTKEIAVRDFINLNFEGFQHDAPLWTGNCDCTHRRRIDHRKLIGNTLLCIETDENQHKGYDATNEEIRYDDLYMLHGGKFIFIRFNPDKFKNKAGKNQNPMLYTRLPVLKEEIERQIKRIENEENNELLEIIKLYYDE
jgi:hypothetical protein